MTFVKRMRQIEKKYYAMLSQNLGSNQVVGSDGTVIDLGNNQQSTVKK